jgi:hypothetical protein
MAGRNLVIFISLTLLLAACFAWMGGQGCIGRGGYPFIVVYLLAHVLMLGLWRTWPFRKRGALALVVLALAMRTLMFPMEVSDDVNRYAWEGRIQNEGFNPYLLAPDAAELAHLRDEVWEGINHKSYSTIYPPAAQLLFRGCDLLWQDMRCLRIVFVLFDLGTLWILFRLAGRYGMAKRHLILYALNPLLMVYVAGEGHMDSVHIFFIVAALRAALSKRDGPAFFLLGMGAMFKFVPLIFLPLFLNRGNWRKCFLFLPPLLLCLPYALDGTNLLRTPALFASTFSYNGFLYAILDPLFLHGSTVQAACWMVFALLAACIFLLAADLFRSAYLLAGAVLLCSPIMHQWYFLLILPFLPFFRSPAWGVLLATLAATFATRILQYETGEWIDFPLARFLEYAPFVLIGLFLFLRGSVIGPMRFPAPRRLSVIIPTLNEADQIAQSIRSAASGPARPFEILVADGGSTDGTLARIEKEPLVKIVESPRGRGIQIANAVARAEGDVVLILHADSRLESGALSRLMRALEENPPAAGGAFGSTYREPSLRFKMIAFLDNVRARLLGVPFGNQGQFFRKDAIERGFPDLLLMEDVELAFRVRAAGASMFLPRGISNVARRWQRVGFWRNTGIVLYLTGLFVVKRRLGLLRGRGEEFYRKYYGSPAGRSDNEG